MRYSTGRTSRTTKRRCLIFGMSRFLANIQNGLLLRDSGMIDGSSLDVLVGYMVLCVRTTGGATWWRDTMNAHSYNFV